MMIPQNKIVNTFSVISSNFFPRNLAIFTFQITHAFKIHEFDMWKFRFTFKVLFTSKQGNKKL